MKRMNETTKVGTMFIGIVYDYDNIEPIRVFGPFPTTDEALAAGQAYVHSKVMDGTWSPDVLSPDYEEIQVITEPLYATLEEERNDL